ncbi:site-specific integrase [Bradyrhizobium hereditatis]|uniref:site-specific integrase n=1 Tax=Bradyrhizobium hereditatis TaxID=2821405 RepID=UPI0028A2C5B2|nr:site-specific integrase [Bradyrhizobium hereditatis]
MIGSFLRWCDKTNRQLRDLQPEDVDAYFVAKATGRWSRVSVASTASALRGFLRYAAERGMCTDRGLDLPASALSSGVAAVCPRLVRRAAHVG